MSDQLTLIAGVLGHVATVRETRRRTYLVECTCGYSSAGRRRRVANPEAVEREARLYLRNHLERAVRDGRVEGRVHITAGGNVAVTDDQGETHLFDV